ncbi:interleukin-37-like [Cricetulus griseus]|uniref:Interleukin-37-like n=1 Tax=Cricetulus griseus TaxID=10029 RepID=A0A9J7G9T0_CRIGR|nr:interleukin-37-like [Cricetulus griseus]
MASSDSYSDVKIDLKPSRDQPESPTEPEAQATMSSESCSDAKNYRKRYRDQTESYTEPKAKCPLLSDTSLVAMLSNHSGDLPRDSGVTSASMKPSSPNKHFIRDTNQQILVLEGNTLVAVPDKKGKRGETFYVSTLPRARSSKANKIILAVSKGERYLCCDRVKKPKRPSLELKKMKELKSLSSYKLLPFTFLKEKVGSYFTLESAANRGYFIYTCNRPRQPVGVTKELGKKNTHFEFINANVDLSEIEN